MTEWAEVKSTDHGNCIVMVRRPVLTEEERERRMSEVREAATAVYASYLRNIHNKEAKPHE